MKRFLSRFIQQKSNLPVWEIEAHIAWNKYWRQIQWLAFHSVFLKKQSKSTFLENYNAVRRTLYRIKSAICFLVNSYRTQHTQSKDYNDINICFCNVQDDYYEDYIIPGGNWTSLYVGPGVFKNWYIDIHNDSSY